MKKNKDLLVDNDFNHRLDEKVLKKVIRTLKGCGFGEILGHYPVSSNYDRLHFIYKNLIFFEKALVLVTRKEMFTKISDMETQSYAFQIFKTGHYSISKEEWEEARKDSRIDLLINCFNANINFNPINHKSSFKNNK